MVFFTGGGGQIRSRHGYGGAKNLTFQKNHTTNSAFSVPKGGANSIGNFDGGHGRICPPWIHHCRSLSLILALKNCINTCMLLSSHLTLRPCKLTCLLTRCIASRCML